MALVLYADALQIQIDLATLEWPSDTPVQLHAATTAQAGRLQAPEHDAVIRQIQEWHGLAFEIDDPTRWQQMWDPGAAVQQSSLQWQILYRVNATNSWRFPTASSHDQVTWCPTCNLNRKEQNRHLFRECHFA